jgi:hypothetical protein
MVHVTHGPELQMIPVRAIERTGNMHIIIKQTKYVTFFAPSDISQSGKFSNNVSGHTLQFFRGKRASLLQPLQIPVHVGEH